MTIPDGAARQRTSCRTALAIALAPSLFSASPARALIQGATCVASQPEVKSVAFHGNKSIPSQTLEATIETAPSSTVRRLMRVFGTRRCLPEGALQRDAARLMLFYRRKGYPRVAVDTAVERAGTGGIRVRFSIKENAPTAIDSVEIRGVSDAMRPRLRRAIQLRPGDPLDRFSLEASSAAMVAGLRRAGYLSSTARSGSRVDSAAMHGVGWIEVTPGTRMRLGDVHVATRGADSARPQIPASRVAGITRLRPGAVLGSHELADARRSLEAVGLYDEIRVSVDSSRRAPVADGVVDGIADAVGNRVGDGVADVTVGVVEGSPNEVRLRAGYGTLDCIRLQLQGHRLGIARRPGRFEITTRLSKVAVGKPLDFAPGFCSSEVQADPYSSRLNYYVGGTYAVNSLGPHGWSRQLSVYTERRSEYLAYLKTTNIGGSASLTHGFGKDWSGTASYDLSYGRTEAQPAVLCATFSACLAADREQFSETLPFGLLSLAATFDNTDAPFDPTRGVSLRAEGRIAPRWLGTAVRQQVAGARVNAAAYVSLAKRVVLAGRAQAAVVATLAGGDFIPQGERLFAGGASTVRGFQQNEVGPRVYLADSVRMQEIRGDTLIRALPPDSTHWQAVPTGGTTSAVANIELRVRPPVYTSLLQFVAFVDAGKVWTNDDTHQVNGTPIYVTPGVGVRASTPIGPIRLDVASNAYDPPGGPAYRDAPLGYETAPLYCVSPGNLLPVTGFGQTDAQGKPIPPVQVEGHCPPTFRPSRKSGFFNRLTITFSIGQAF